MPGGLTRIAVGSDPRAQWLEAGDGARTRGCSPIGRSSSSACSRASGEPAAASRRPRPAEPHRRQSVLARPLHRARRRRRAAAAQPRVRLGGEMGSTRNIVSPERVVSMLIVQKHLSARRGRRAMQEGREAVQRRALERAVRPRTPRRPRDRARQRAAQRGGRARTAVVRHVQRILARAHRDHASWELSPGHETDDALRLLNRLIPYLAAFSGMEMENMTRGYGWRFLDMGRRLERRARSIQLIQQLARARRAGDDGGLELLLELADSIDDLPRPLSGRAAAAAPCSTCCSATRRTRARLVFQMLRSASTSARLPSDGGGDGILTADADRDAARQRAQARGLEPSSAAA